LKGIQRNLNNLIKSLFIKAKIIKIQKKFSQLFPVFIKPLASNFAIKTLESKLVSLGSEKIELNSMNIEGILINLLNSVLFIKAKIIIHNCDGFKNKKNLYVKVNTFL